MNLVQNSRWLWEERIHSRRRTAPEGFVGTN
jgi:hypothetical protein